MHISPQSTCPLGHTQEFSVHDLLQEAGQPPLEPPLSHSSPPSTIPLPHAGSLVIQFIPKVIVPSILRYWLAAVVMLHVYPEFAPSEML
jgi:hypothetical protein